MISIRCNGIWLDMPTGSSIRTEFVSSMFQTDLFEGSYSFPFDLPASGLNLRTLGFPNVLSVINRRKEWPVELFYNGVKVFDCKMSLQKGTRLVLTVNLITGLAGLEVLDKKLPELNLGGERYIGPDAPDMVAHANSLIHSYWPKLDYVFAPHWNPDFYGESNPDFQQVVNRWDMINQTFLLNDATVPVNQNCMVPFAFAAYIIKQGFAEAGISVDGDFFKDPELSQLVVYNNYALDGSSTAYNVRISSDEPHDLDISDNYRIHLNNITTPPNYGNPALFDTVLNQYEIALAARYTAKVTAVIGFASSAINNTVTVNMCNSAGTILDSYSHQSNYPGMAFINGEIFYSASPADLGDHLHFTATGVDETLIPLNLTVYSMSVEIIANASTNRYTTTINLQNHVPSITFGDFLKELRGTENLSFAFNRLSNTVSINRTEIALKKKAKEDYTGLITREYENEYEYNGGYKFNYNFTGNDALTEDNFKTFNDGQRIDDVTHYAALPSAADYLDKIALVLNTNSFYIAQTDPVFGPIWSYYSDNHSDVVIGEGQSSAQVNCSPLLMRLFNNVGGHALMPAVREKGQSNFFPNGATEFTDLRFVVWRGLQAGQSGNLYPLISSTNYDYLGTRIGERALRWNGDDGVYEYSWKNWVAVLMRGEYVRRMINMNITHLLTLTEEKKRIGYQSFLFRRVSASWGKSIDAAEVEMYQV